jgi:hypothetical protein
MELYKTNNTNLAAFLKAKGFALEKTESIDGIIYFCFSNERHVLDNREPGVSGYAEKYLINKPHDSHLSVNVRDLFDARAELLELIKR